MNNSKLAQEIKVQGDTIIYNGATYKKVEVPKEPKLRDRLVEVLETHIDMYEYADHIDTYPLLQDLMDHIIEWIPDYSHNDEVTIPENVVIHNLEDFRKGWNAHATETFKIYKRV